MRTMIVFMTTVFLMAGIVSNVARAESAEYEAANEHFSQAVPYVEDHTRLSADAEDAQDAQDLKDARVAVDKSLAILERQQQEDHTLVKPVNMYAFRLL